LKKHKEPADSLNRQVSAKGNIGEVPGPMPLVPTQEVRQEHWLKKDKEPVDLRISQAPAEERIGKTREPMPLTPTQKSLLESWAKEPVDLRKRKPPGGHEKHQNPKWSNDRWFEKRYGDPDYYSRVKGLN
jgi:hypothetical protein